MILSRIIQLDTLVSNQIAAGEVVERPASVVKELIENSLDAGASKIEIEIEGDGSYLIRIRDNGSGILKADLPLAFSRHATSKIRLVEDLSMISSLGFRGEALASIASVSRTHILSHANNEKDAWKVLLDSHLQPIISPAAHPIGTTIEVADLFYNTPVRRKFLRSEKTEVMAIIDVVKRLALGYPETSFYLQHEQRLIRHYPSLLVEKNETERMGKICGQSFKNQSIPISMNAVGLKIQGWVGKPSLNKRQADCQYFFVNRRMVKDRLLTHAIKDIYQQHAKDGTYPSYVLYLTLDPGEVDVNVHPTKQEVRFSQARLIHDFILKSVHQAFTYEHELEIESNLCKRTTALPCQYVVQKSNLFQSEKELPKVEEKYASSLKIQEYGLWEDEQGVILFNVPHAQPYLFALYFESHWQRVPTKNILFPLYIELSKRMQNPIADWRAFLLSVGFETRLENKTQLFLVKQPACLNKQIEKNALLHLIDRLVATKSQKESLCLLGEWIVTEIKASLAEEHFSILLPVWLKSAKNGWFRLDNREIQQRMKKVKDEKQGSPIIEEKGLKIEKTPKIPEK